MKIEQGDTASFEYLDDCAYLDSPYHFCQGCNRERNRQYMAIHKAHKAHCVLPSCSACMKSSIDDAEPMRTEALTDSTGPE